MKEGLIKDVYEAIAKEIQLILTVTYLLMIGIGMLFNHQKYSEFGINIFQYADVFDFLVAPFEDWRIIAISLFSVALSIGIFKFDVFWQRKSPKTYSKMTFGWDKKPWYSVFRYLTFTFLFVLYLIECSDIYGRKSKEENSKF